MSPVRAALVASLQWESSLAVDGRFQSLMHFLYEGMTRCVFDYLFVRSPDPR